MLRPPRALLLDLDGTLLDTEVGRDAARGAVGAIVEREHGVSAERWRQADASAADELWRVHGDERTLGRLATADVGTRICARALEYVGAPVGPAPRLASVFSTAVLREARLYPDAEPLVDRARALGIRCAVVTNGASDTQRGALDAAGLLGRLDAVVASAEHGIAKPDTGLFRIALDALGADPADAWHVGDSLASDIVGARAAGISAIWVDRTRSGRVGDDPIPDATVGGLDDVRRLLDQGR